MFIVLRPCDGFPDVSSVALTLLFVWRCLPIGVSVLTLSLKSGEGMRILSVATSRGFDHRIRSSTSFFIIRIVISIRRNPSPMPRPEREPAREPRRTS